MMESGRRIAASMFGLERSAAQVANAQRALALVTKRPHFDDRLLANFFEQKVDPGTMFVTKEHNATTVLGSLPNSPLGLKLLSYEEGSVHLAIVDGSQDPLSDWNLVRFQRWNEIGMNNKDGGLNGDFHEGYNHPHAAEAFRLMADLAEQNRATRSIDAMLEGYPTLSDPRAVSYIRLLREFTDPGSIRLKDRRYKDTQSVVAIAGLMNHPVLNRDALVLHVAGWGLRHDNQPQCYINWSGDEGEKWAYPRQTSFSYDNVGVFVARELGLTPGTTRAQVSGEMLNFLNSPQAPRP